MANPVQKLIALAKSGDRRVLLGGAALLGGGIGLIVFLSNRGGGAGLLGAGGLSSGLSLGDLSGGGGGSGGGGTSDLGTLFEETVGESVSLPELADIGAAADTGGTSAWSDLFGSTLPSNLASSDPITFPELPEYLTAAPAFGGAGGFDFGGLPELPQMPSYTGGSYGNDLGSSPALPTVSGAVANVNQQSAPVAPKQPSSAGLFDAPEVHAQALNVRRSGGSSGKLSPAEQVSLVLQATPPTKQISQADVSGLQRLAAQIAAPLTRQPDAAQATKPISKADTRGLQQMASNLQVYNPEVRAPGGGVYLRGPGEAASAYIARATQYVQQMIARQQQIPAQVVNQLANTATRQISAADRAGLSAMAAQIPNQPPVQQATRQISTADRAGLSAMAARFPSQPTSSLVVKNRIDDLR